MHASEVTFVHGINIVITSPRLTGIHPTFMPIHHRFMNSRELFVPIGFQKAFVLFPMKSVLRNILACQLYPHTRYLWRVWIQNYFPQNFEASFSRLSLYLCIVSLSALFHLMIPGSDTGWTSHKNIGSAL